MLVGWIGMRWSEDWRGKGGLFPRKDILEGTRSNDSVGARVPGIWDDGVRQQEGERDGGQSATGEEQSALDVVLMTE
jgi:hypothetical protein